MTYFEAFACLGIPVTKDPAAIKKAYQKQLPQHHPEEDPQGFMQLHQAYKTALSYTQGTDGAKTFRSEVVWQPQEPATARDETGYDNLFSHLDEQQEVDLPQLRKIFTRKLRLLKLYWLPIPLKLWRQFFASEAFRGCRGDAECMEKLFALMAEKIHSYHVFRFLLDRLWELESWQKSEAMEKSVKETRACIMELQKQYSHYLKNDAALQLLQMIWYYEALPFYFKLFLSTFLIPLMSCGSADAMILLLLGFYILELCIWIRKASRKLGIFHPTARKKRGILKYESRGESGIVIVATIYLILIHVASCFSVMAMIG